MNILEANQDNIKFPRRGKQSITQKAIDSEEESWRRYAINAPAVEADRATMFINARIAALCNVHIVRGAGAVSIVRYVNRKTR